jgi:hypothetical protein
MDSATIEIKGQLKEHIFRNFNDLLALLHASTGGTSLNPPMHSSSISSSISHKTGRTFFFYQAMSRFIVHMTHIHKFVCVCVLALRR